MTPEGRVKKAIKDWLKTLPNCWFFMPGANGYGVHGVPDLIICYHSVFVAIEVKAPGKLGTVTPLQQMQVRAINHAFGYAIVADDLQQVKDLIHDIDTRLRVGIR